MSRSNRLVKSADFRKVYKAGRSYSSPLMVAYARSNSDESAVARFGIVASAKVGGAVKRNRARRQIREALRTLRNLSTSKPVDVVLVVRKPCTLAEYADIVNALRYLMARCGMIEDHHDTCNPAQRIR